MKRFLKSGVTLFMVVFSAVTMISCSQRSSELETYIAGQEKKIVQKSLYNQGELLFWAGILSVTSRDLEELRSAWRDHSKAFPESKNIEELERETRKGKVVVVCLFMTDFDKADLLNKALGWSAFPVAAYSKELAEGDTVLRTLFPVKNSWAKFFLLRYDSSVLEHSAGLIIANREGKVELKINQEM